MSFDPLTLTDILTGGAILLLFIFWAYAPRKERYSRQEELERNRKDTL